MNLLVTPSSNTGITLDTAQAANKLTYVRFRHLKLAASQSHNEPGGSDECCIVVLSGKFSVRCSGRDFGVIGARNDIFEQTPPYAFYVPDGMDYTVTALTDGEAALCNAPGGGHYEPRVIRPTDVRQSVRGKDSNMRYIHDILPESEPAHSLLVVEVYTPAGNWSSYPPHKHDTEDPPRESLLEETYYHRINPPRAFGFQRVYTDDRSLDEAVAFGDGSCVLVPRGYHPVGAPYGCELYYLNVMAGPQRAWHFSTDPDFSWLSA